MTLPTLPSLEAASNAVTTAATCSAITLWGLQLSDVAVIVSAIVAVLGFFVTSIATLRRERREIAEQRARMEELQRGGKASPRKRATPGGASRR